MISRRTLLALAGLAGLTAATSACGSGSSTGGDAGSDAFQLVSAKLPRSTASPAALTAATSAVTSFTADLYAKIAANADGNAVCSPYSVAVALGMTAQGARGQTAAQLLKVLHATDATSLAAGLNAIDVALASRSGSIPDPRGGDDLVVRLDGANSLWGQRGMTWQQPFLDVLARDFGTGMRQVDYEHAPETARRAINAWVSDRTHTKIPELLAQGVIDVATRLTLVNALYLKAPWQSPFEQVNTGKAPFTRLDGSTVAADLMTDGITAGYAKGPGWVAADLPYARGELAMAVVVPDAGRFAEVEKAVDGGWLATLLAGFAPDDEVQVGLPRWTSRTSVSLQDALSALGMPLAFRTGADFSAMTTQDQLSIGAVLHEGFIAVDEAGTEAAASTAVVMVATAGRVSTEKVIADRPFLYVIHDRATRTPLFVGRVLDPTTT